MRIVFMGCVKFSKIMLELLLTLPSADIVGVITKDDSPINSDFTSLIPTAAINGIPSFIAKKNDQVEIAKWTREKAPDLICCFGWSYLLNSEMLNISKIGVIGYHPAALPSNRGRHPIIWALVLGLRETASTFFIMNEDADSGDIISQERVVISDNDDANSLYEKLALVAKNQIESFIPSLGAGSFSFVRQDDSKSNYWRKRTKSDGRIDWRMSARSIHNLVRGLTRPYVGAHCDFCDTEVKIWKTKIIQSDNYGSENIEPGKVIESSEKSLVIKCGEGVLELIEHGFNEIPTIGTYL